MAWKRLTTSVRIYWFAKREWGDTNPKYMDPVDRRLRRCLN